MILSLITISKALLSLLKYVSVELEMPLEIKSIKFLSNCGKHFMWIRTFKNNYTCQHDGACHLGVMHGIPWLRQWIEFLHPKLYCHYIKITTCAAQKCFEQKL